MVTIKGVDLWVSGRYSFINLLDLKKDDIIPNLFTFNILKISVL